jgi:YesN/AraC family two-component response regulator
LSLFKADPAAFDLVLTDMTMPNMTGIQLAEKLISIRPDIPIILCTGYSERIGEKKVKAMGVNGFLLKPVDKSEMAKMVRNVLDEVKG